MIKHNTDWKLIRQKNNLCINKDKNWWKTRLQRAFNVLLEMFDRFGLHTNVGNMVIMARKYCCEIGVHSM